MTQSIAIDALIDELLQAGENPSDDLLERIRAAGPAIVPALIDLAQDEDLIYAESDSPEVWAPIHALGLLRDLHPPEAVGPLIALLEKDYDSDWFTELIPEALGAIGRPALGPVRTVLLDRTQGIYQRIGAAGALEKIGELHPETRADVVLVLVSALDLAEPEDTLEPEVNGFVVSALTHLKAVEAQAIIREAYAAGFVDEFIIRLEDVEAVFRGEDLSEYYKRTALPEDEIAARMQSNDEYWRSVAARQKTGRNDPCPCASGQKFKRCHGR